MKPSGASGVKFHWHTNLVLVLEKGTDLNELRKLMFSRFRESVVKINPLAAPTEEGFHLSSVDGATTMASYMSGVSKSRSMSLELASATNKLASRSSNSKTIFEALVDILETGNPRSVQMLREWESQWYRMRRYSVSHHLEKSLDEELISNSNNPSLDSLKAKIEGGDLVLDIPCSVSVMGWVVQRRRRAFITAFLTRYRSQLSVEFDLFEKLCFVSLQGLLTPEATYRYLDKLSARIGNKLRPIPLS